MLVGSTHRFRLRYGGLPYLTARYEFPFLGTYIHGGVMHLFGYTYFYTIIAEVTCNESSYGLSGLIMQWIFREVNPHESGSPLLALPV